MNLILNKDIKQYFKVFIDKDINNFKLNFTKISGDYNVYVISNFNNDSKTKNLPSELNYNWKL